MKNFIPKIKKLKKVWFGLFLFLILSIFSYWPLLKPGYFSMHDDVQVMRLYQMERCFLDGQLPCRLVPDMGAGYGHPLYNYHPVFPYYLGIIFRLFNLSFLDISKILFLLAILLSGIFMYFLVRQFFGNFAALLGSLFFIYAPYHAVDVYVRGALSESWGITFFPLIFLSFYKFVKEEKIRWFVLSIFSLTFLFLSHNIMTLIFTPIAFFWGMFWIFFFKKWKTIWKLFFVFIWALGLAAFFILPAFLERPFVKIETLISDYYNFRYHFVTLRQLFLDRSFGYGPSRPGPLDDISFQLGWPHWWLAVFSVFIAFFFLLKKKKEQFYLFSFWILLFFFSVFMTHAKSFFLWEMVPLLSFVQFPWRFLGMAMFASSFLAAGTILFLRGKLKYLFGGVLIILVILLNFGYFKPEKHFPSMTDKEKLSGEEWKNQSMATLLDYLPKKVQEFPKELASSNPWVVEGEAKISEFRKRSNFWRFTIETSGMKPVLVSVPVFDFPNWVVLVDQKPVSFSSDNPLGIIEVWVPSGKHTVVGWFIDTKLRTFANFLSLLSFAFLILFLVYVDQKNKKTF